MRQPWKGIVLVGACLLLLLPLARSGERGETGEHRTEAGQLQFLQRHWQTPIPLQGPPPTTFSQLEASLQPERCGVCHHQQYQDWKRTLHAKSMGPGVRGQTQGFVQQDPATALLCYSCHAPLSEQAERLQDQGSFVDNPLFDPEVQVKGLTCAGCHVRKHERFGPPYREGSPAASLLREELPHRGAMTTPAFERSEFCRSCHQFGEDGYALNGKLLENTYNEWRDGPYATAGTQCQSCHMPDRRHLWRGIHDPEQVRKGVTIRLNVSKARYRPGETTEAVLTIENSGVGHYFPTYVTPKVFVRAEFLDEQGRRVEGSLQQAVIGREVTLDLSRELYDTRIPPKESFTFRYNRPVGGKGWRLKVQVTVHPDHFYERFFESVLQSNTFPGGRDLLQEALEQTRQSTFSIFSREIPIS